MDISSAENRVRLTARQLATAVVLIISLGCQGLCYSSISSYFPQRALTKGCTTTDVGLILGSFAFSTLLFTFGAPSLMKRYGIRRILIVAPVISMISAVPFAFVMHISPGFLFIVSCIAIRLAQGIGVAGIQLPTMSLFTSEFRSYLSLFTGLIQMTFAAGTTIGPFVGGALFDKWGFPAPSLFMAGISLVLTIMIYFFVHPNITPQEQESEETPGSVLRKLAKIPDFIFPITAYLFMAIGLTMLDVSLGPRLTNGFGISSTIVGCFFMVPAGINMILAPIIGIFNDKKGYHEIVIIIGCLLLSSAQLLYGPVPFLGIKTTLVTVLVSLIMMGVAFPMIMVPMIVSSMNILKFRGISETQAVIDVINGGLIILMNFGDLLGPFLGGVFIQHLTLKWTCLVFACFSLSVCISGICVLSRRRWYSKEKHYRVLN